MSKLFSTEWIVEFAQAWNADRQMEEHLFAHDFNANIGYGFIDQEHPQAILVVEDGKVKSAGLYSNQSLDWDLRASPASWQQWLQGGFGMASLGAAVASGKLKFIQGNYYKMIRDSGLSKAFLRHFELMSGLNTKYQ